MRGGTPPRTRPGRRKRQSLQANAFSGQRAGHRRLRRKLRASRATPARAAIRQPRLARRGMAQTIQWPWATKQRGPGGTATAGAGDENGPARSGLDVVVSVAGRNHNARRGRSWGLARSADRPVGWLAPEQRAVERQRAKGRDADRGGPGQFSARDNGGDGRARP